MNSLQDKIVWITGAGSGIGLAAATELARAGAHVVLSGRRLDVLEAAQTKIQGEGGAASVAPLDVADAKIVERVAKGLLARHGKVDILINSAGLNVPGRHWKDITAEDWQQVIDINLNGALYCTRAVLPAMRAQRDGLIVNISSWAGRYDVHMTGPAYNASKHGVLAMTASLNMEEGVNGVRACVICPGEVATPIMARRPVPPGEEDLRRMLQPDDLGRTIRFVAEMPAHACLNEIVISPTWNRLYIGVEAIPRR